MTKHEKEIIYRQLYEEKVLEWKNEALDEFFALSAVFFDWLWILIVGPWVVSEGVWLIFFLYFGIVLVVFFIYIGINLRIRKKLPKDFAEYINSGLCIILPKLDDKGNTYYDIDMGEYMHRTMSEDEMKIRLMKGVERK